jgi:hypothetical protein
MQIGFMIKLKIYRTRRKKMRRKKMKNKPFRLQRTFKKIKVFITDEVFSYDSYDIGLYSDEIISLINKKFYKKGEPK